MLSMFLAYRMFLARENQHSYNRHILLVIYAVAFATLPLISLVQQLVVHEAQPTLAMEGNEFTPTAITEVSKPMWGTVLIWIFVAGMIVVAFKTSLIWMRLINVIHSGEKIKKAGYTLVLTDNERFAPFSWMRYIIISRSDFENNCSAITVHEMKHITCRHWIDLLIAQAICTINWFNPAAWLMRDELMLVHEYQADMAVIDSGHDAQEYQMLLIKKAVGARFPSLANSLNHSKLKKRITMMYKEKSGAGRKLNALALVPMLALALSVAAVPTVRAAMSTISNSEVSVGKDNENPTTSEISAQNFEVVSLNNYDDKTTVTLKGMNLGDVLTVSGVAFTTMGNTYQANSMQCDMANGTATITATFPFTDKYKDTSMQLTANGKKIRLYVQDFLSNQQPAAGSAMQSTVSNGGYLPGGLKIFIDGEEAGRSQVEILSANDIEAISINKQDKSMMITTKK